MRTVPGKNSESIRPPLIGAALWMVCLELRLNLYSPAAAPGRTLKTAVMSFPFGKAVVASISTPNFPAEVWLSLVESTADFGAFGLIADETYLNTVGSKSSVNETAPRSSTDVASISSLIVPPATAFISLTLTVTSRGFSGELEFAGGTLTGPTGDPDAGVGEAVAGDVFAGAVCAAFATLGLGAAFAAGSCDSRQASDSVVATQTSNINQVLKLFDITKR